MKRIFFQKLITCSTIILLSGCTDILNVAPDGTLTMEQVFSDNDKVAAYLNTCYSYVPAKGNWYYFTTSIPTTLSDEAWDADDCTGMRVLQYYNGNVSAGGNPLYDDMPGTNKRLGTYWKYYWTAIRQCSIFLKNIQNATVNNATDRARWEAEAHVLRAYYYMELLKWYGASFPVRENPYEINENFTTLKKSTYGQIVQFIVEDCNLALSTDALPWRITTEAEKMRTTKAIAEAIKSKAVLYAVSPRFDDGTYTKEQAYQLNKISLQNIRNNGYELYNKNNDITPALVYTEPYLDVFQGVKKEELIRATGAIKEYFCNWVDYSTTPRDKETIWEHQVAQDRQWLTASFIGRYKCGACPSQEYVDAFEVTDGNVAYPILNLEQPYIDDVEPTHLKPNYNPNAFFRNYNGIVNARPLYDTINPYKNRDPRFYANIYYNGSKRFDPSSNSWMYIWTNKEDPLTGIRPGNSDAYRPFTRTGYYSQKFLHPTEGLHDLSHYGPGWRLFRLGEIILNVAELAVEAGHPSEAVPLLNEIRKRSAMPNILPANSNDIVEMRRIVHQERRIELGFEEARYFDIRRWTEKGDDKDLKQTDKWITAMEISDKSAANDHSLQTYTRRLVRSDPRECYKSKFLLQPIPLDEATRLQQITGENWQNPGW
jgi:hypothetical protein